jgi:hypothetical protein
LGKLQILEEKLTLRNGVVAEEDKVHVCNWATRMQVPAQHLDNRLYVECKSSDGGLGSEE